MASSSSSPEHRRAKLGFYMYAWACEVFSCVSVAVFLPILLEQLARSHGYFDHDTSKPCLQANGQLEGGICAVKIGWSWVDTASFSLFIKSASVAVQAVTVISVSVLADVGTYRIRLLLLFALLGAVSATLFLILPTSSSHSTVILISAAILAVTSVACFGDSFVCLNAFLPGVVEGAEDVVLARRKVDGVREEGDGMVIVDDEETALMAGQAFPMPDDATKSKVSEYHRAISLATSRISSIGIGVGYVSGVSMLCLMLIPVTVLRGSLFSLRLAIGISGIWWGVWTIPAARLLQSSGAVAEDAEGYDYVKGKLKEGWTRLGTMLRWHEIQRLSVTFWYLLAWALLSDAFNTTTSLAVLFGRTSLSMPSSHVILIGILTQSTAIVSSIYTPRFQRRFGGVNGLSNLHMLVGCVIGVMIMCAYVLLGFVGGWKVGGLRTEGEMYACAVWFGIVSAFGWRPDSVRLIAVVVILPAIWALQRTLKDGVRGDHTEGECGGVLGKDIVANASLADELQGHEARFFSLFSITDKSASFLGPAVVGIIADYTGEIRYGFLFLLFLLAVPIPILLWCVDVEKGREDAAVYAMETSQHEQERLG